MKETRTSWYNGRTPIEPLPMSEIQIIEAWERGEKTVSQLAKINSVSAKIIYDILKDNGAWIDRQTRIHNRDLLDNLFDLPCRRLPILETNCEESRIIREILSHNDFFERELYRDYGEEFLYDET